MLTTLTTTAALHPHGWAGGPGLGFGWLFFLIPLFWIGVVILIVALVGRRHRAAWYPGGYGYGRGAQPPAPVSATQAAERTLAERFAHGDIDEVEYRARLEVLRANRASES
jgi:putative membrane protein